MADEWVEIVKRNASAKTIVPRDGIIMAVNGAAPGIKGGASGVYVKLFIGAGVAAKLRWSAGAGLRIRWSNGGGGRRGSR